MWFWLLGAILAEVTGTIALRFSEGFSRLAPSILVVVGYGVAFVALSKPWSAGCRLGLLTGSGPRSGSPSLPLSERSSSASR
jgi:small multidrug resistance pump